MAYQKILVALDRSPLTDVVFEQALELARKDKAQLILLHCLPLENQGVGSYADMFGRELINYSQAIQERREEERQEALSWIATYCQKATEQGVQTEWDCKIGDAGNWIVELAKSWDADLIVLGRRGHRGLTEVVKGSVSNHVVHYAPCSVLVVQGIGSVAEAAEAASQEPSERSQ